MPHDSRHEQEAAHSVQRANPDQTSTRAPAAESGHTDLSPATATELLSNPHIHGRGNAPVRQAAVQRLQQSRSSAATNRLVQRLIQRSAPAIQREIAPMPTLPATAKAGAALGLPVQRKAAPRRRKRHHAAPLTPEQRQARQQALEQDLAQRRQRHRELRQEVAGIDHRIAELQHQGGSAAEITALRRTRQQRVNDLLATAPHYKQADPLWSPVTYGPAGGKGYSSIGTGGCGPTSLSIALNYLNDDDATGPAITPTDTAQYSVNAGARPSGGGTDGTKMVEKLGSKHSPYHGQFQGRTLALGDEAAVTRELRNGNPVIFLSHGAQGTNGHHYGGHYMVFNGINDDGTYRVVDPAGGNITAMQVSELSRRNSAKAKKHANEHVIGELLVVDRVGHAPAAAPGTAPVTTVPTTPTGIDHPAAVTPPAQHRTHPHPAPTSAPQQGAAPAGPQGQVDVGNPPADSYHRASNQIVATIESGGDYGGMYTSPTDNGIVTYGIHQATVNSGDLLAILDLYIKNAGPQNATAQALKSEYRDWIARDRGKTRDEPLRHAALKGGRLRELLKAAAKDEAMIHAQDTVFTGKYWVPAKREAQQIGVTSALGYTVLYDSLLQGQKMRIWNLVRTRLGLPHNKHGMSHLDPIIGVKGTDGKPITEEQFLRAYLEERQSWLGRGNADMRASTYRTKAYLHILGKGDLDLRGDADGPHKGMVELRMPHHNARHNRDDVETKYIRGLSDHAYVDEWAAARVHPGAAQAGPTPTAPAQQPAVSHSHTNGTGPAVVPTRPAPTNGVPTADHPAAPQPGAVRPDLSRVDALTKRLADLEQQLHQSNGELEALIAENKRLMAEIDATNKEVQAEIARLTPAGGAAPR